MGTRNGVAAGLVAKVCLAAAVLMAGLPACLHAQQANAWQINDNSTFSGVLEYVTNLSPAQVAAARTNGWHYSLLSRMLPGGSGPAAQSMAFGDGARRFYVYLSLDSSGNLTAQLVSSSNVTYTLPVPATDVLKFHLHELVYTPATSQAVYRCDGNPIASWVGDFSSNQSNQVMWGANSSLGKWAMNYHRAEFDINGQGAVAIYDAGFAGNPAMAPSPGTQGWTRLASGIALAEAALSPDGEYIHPAVTTSPASGLRPGEALLNGNINPNGWPAFVWFDHGPTTSYGSSTPLMAAGSGTAFVSNSVLVTALPRGTLYHFRAMASNSVGVIEGTDMSFTVPDTPPIASGPAGGGQPVDIRQPALELNYILCTEGTYPVQGGGSPPFIGEVRLFAGNFAPAGWVLCQGQVLDISSNQALFSLLGTTYGGDGMTNFNLPDLRGRTVAGTGTGPAGTLYTGEWFGVNQLTLLTQQIPAHVHALPAPYGVSGSAGGGQPHENRKPSLALSCLAWLQGYYPLTGTNVLEPFLGQLSFFAGNFAAGGTALAQGQVLPINQNQALYNVLSTNYGGDGQTTFALPNLQTRTPLGAGQGAGLSAWSVGQQPGVETVTLTEAQLPAHQHLVPWVPPLSFMTALDGGGQPETLMQPSLAMQYLVATNGELPSASVQATNKMLGEIQVFEGKGLPGGWTPCAGQVLSVAAWPGLFSVLSNRFGGDGVTTFALPDLSGRIPVGATNAQPGALYGAEQAALMLAQLPSHTHTVPALDYDRWVTAFGLSGANAAYDMDSDNDGVKNGIEWATGTNPTNPASFAPLTITLAGPAAAVQFPRNTNATDVSLFLQRTPNLANSTAWFGLVTNVAGIWSPPGLVTETGGGNPVTVTLLDRLTNNPAASYRLRVTQP